MQNDFMLCPMCGGRSIQNERGRKWYCPDCGFDLYCNVAAAVGVLIVDDRRNVLFERRAKEPRKGFLTQPGGFVDADESAEDAARRECVEELGVQIGGLSYVGSYPNTYQYRGIAYKTCDLFFAARVEGVASLRDFAATLNLQKSEVEQVVVLPVADAESLATLPLAFESTRHALKTLFCL